MSDKLIKHDKILESDRYGIKCIFEDKNGHQYKAFMTKREFRIMMLMRKFEKLGYDTNLIDKFRDLIEEQTSDQCEENFSERNI